MLMEMVFQSVLEKTLNARLQLNGHRYPLTSRIILATLRYDSHFFNEKKLNILDKLKFSSTFVSFYASIM